MILLIHSRKINLLMLGEEDAACLGVDVKRLRRRLLILCSILVAATVSVSGIIGFVGLIIPHCVKLVCGSDNRRVMPYGFLSGATFMVICDTIARTIAAPSEIPVGVITSICGVPFFIWLVMRNNGERQ
jgi:iron complex transport system permease protein